MDTFGGEGGDGELWTKRPVDVKREKYVDDP